MRTIGLQLPEKWRIFSGLGFYLGDFDAQSYDHFLTIKFEASYLLLPPPPPCLCLIFCIFKKKSNLIFKQKHNNSLQKDSKIENCLSNCLRHL